MSNKALTYAFEADIEKPAAKFVLVALADHATDHAGEDWSCFPAVERLMQFTAQSRSTVERNLAWLVAEGWISRVRRKLKGGRLGVYDYVIHRQKRDASDVESAPDSEANHTSECRVVHASNEASTMRQIDGQPHVNLPHVLTPIEPSVEPSLSAGAHDADAITDLIWEIWPEAGKAASSHRLVGQAVRTEMVDGAPPARLETAAKFYAGNRDRWGSSGRPLSPHKFLTEGRWETMADAAEAARGSAKARTAFACAELRATVAAAGRDEAWLASWLDPCGWDAKTRTIDPRLGNRAAKLRSEIGDLLKSEGVKLKGLG